MSVRLSEIEARSTDAPLLETEIRHLADRIAAVEGRLDRIESQARVPSAYRAADRTPPCRSRPPATRAPA